MVHSLVGCDDDQGLQVFHGLCIWLGPPGVSLLILAWWLCRGLISCIGSILTKTELWIGLGPPGVSLLIFAQWLCIGCGPPGVCP